jgi:hypothetical protein
MLQDTLKAAVDTVQVAKSTGFSWAGLAGAIVTAVVSAVVGYFGGKKGGANVVAGRR